MQFFKYTFSTLFCFLIINTVYLPAVNNSFDHVVFALSDLADSRYVGEAEATFFEEATSQISSYPSSDEEFLKRTLPLDSIYSSIRSFLPLSTMRNSIQLNENGKVLYRVLSEDEGEGDSILYLYDLGTKRVSEIAKSSGYLFAPPYRLNNEDQILYFKNHKIGKKRQVYTVNVLLKNGSDQVLLDLQKLDWKNNDYQMNADDFIKHYVSDMDLGFLSSVEFNDLGQALFYHGDDTHSTWLMGPDKLTNKFLDQRYRVLGFNNQGDVFIDYKDKNKGTYYGIYQSKQGKLKSFPGNIWTRDYIITNNLGSAVFPLSCEADENCLPLYYSYDGKIDLVPSLGGSKIFPQSLNDSGQLVGFGINSEGYVRGFLYSKENGMKEIQTLGGKRSAAFGVNNHGDIVGFAETSEGKLHAFVKKEDQLTDIGSNFKDTSLAFAISNDGWVLGVYKDEKGRFQTYLYHETKGLLDIAQNLSEEYEEYYVVPIGFNQKGQVVGMFFYVEERQYGSEGSTFTVPETLRFPFVFDPLTGSATRLPNYPSMIDFE